MFLIFLAVDKACRRSGWIDKESFIVKQIPAHITGEIIPNMKSLPQSAKNILMSRENPHIDYTNQILIIHPDGRADSWVPSTSDIFTKEWGFLISENGCIEEKKFEYFVASEKNNATNRKQLEKILALNQLLNIAEYYNRVYIKFDKCYTILYDNHNNKYMPVEVSPLYSFGIKPIFNRMEDAQAVIDNPNFRETLDMVYKIV